MYRNLADERTFVNTGFEYNEPHAPHPSMPQVPQSTGYFPVDVE